MLRSMLSVLIGYVAIALLAAVAMATLVALLGPERIFEPGTLRTQPWWAVAAIGVSFVAALVGGAIATLVGRAGWRPAAVLAFALLVLGSIDIVNNRSKLEPEQLEPGIGLVEALMETKRPTWLVAVLPVVGVLGVLAGGAVVRRALTLDADAV